MAGTLKTDPHGVKTRTGYIPVSESHDHRDGTCDLPAVPQLFTDTACKWDEVWAGTNRFCGCHTCTEHDSRCRQRRRDRHQTRAELLNMLKGNSDD